MYQCSCNDANIAMWSSCCVSTMFCENHSECRRTTFTAITLCDLSSACESIDIRFGRYMAHSRIEQQLLNGHHTKLERKIRFRFEYKWWIFLITNSMNQLHCSQAPDTIGTSVAHSASLYSMSSGSSNVSGTFHHRIIRGNLFILFLFLVFFVLSAGISSSSSISSASGTCTSASTSRTASTSSIYTKVSPESNQTNHRPHEGCGNHCQGAISRNAQYQHHHHHHQQQKLNKGSFDKLQYLHRSRQVMCLFRYSYAKPFTTN